MDERSNKLYYTAVEIQEMLGISKGLAYKILREMNKELKERGFIVVPGRIPKAYFEEHYYGLAN